MKNEGVWKIILLTLHAYKNTFALLLLTLCQICIQLYARFFRQESSKKAMGPTETWLEVAA